MREELHAHVAALRGPFWGTFEQIKAQGGMVRKGQNAANGAGATRITLWKSFVSKDATLDPETGAPREQVFARLIPVFNACQADGLPGRFYPEPGDFEAIAAPQEVIDSYAGSGQAARLIFDEHGRAYYDPAADEIHMPPLTAHKTPEDFYSTAFHELAHSTGAASRLDRPGITELKQEGHGFGSHAYGREELAAEFAASYLLADTGVDGEHVMDNSAAYLASWIPVIAGEPKMLIGAASQGQKAADLILEPSWEARLQAEAGPSGNATRTLEADRDIEAA